MVTAMAVIGISMLVKGAAGEGLLLTLSLALAGFFLWSNRNVVNATAMTAAPLGLQGSAVGLIFLSNLLGVARGVVIMGFVVDTTDSLRSIFRLTAALVTPGIAIFLLAPLKRESLHS